MLTALIQFIGCWKSANVVGALSLPWQPKPSAPLLIPKRTFSNGQTWSR